MDECRMRHSCCSIYVACDTVVAAFMSHATGCEREVLVGCRQPLLVGSWYAVVGYGFQVTGIPLNPNP